MNILIKIILYPFSLLFGILTALRNKFFDWNILHSRELPVPSISVGNITVGGTGKSPHVEYITNLLSKNYTVGIVSRGYRRKNSGFKLAGEQSNAAIIGDEPMQFYNTFKNDPVFIAVDENRWHGCNKLLQEHPEIDVIILDDAFQHRWIKPGLNILLSDFFHPYHKDFLMPTGRLREFRNGYKRADIIVVSKSGKVLSPITRRTLQEEIKPASHQKLYFSFIDYGKPKPIPLLKKTPKWGKTYAILMVTGIANPYPLEAKIAEECTELHKIKYPDHHKFTIKDAVKIKKTFEEIVSLNKIIITTEKDAMRLSTPEIIKIIGHLPVFYWPIHVDLHNEDKEAFNRQILDYVRNHKTNR
ncbi:MAG: tetraacyldisaccharide 4'-kinase [Bacteroidales bacterium]|nr:tetraacyldisaccharide 4'-kinase [Bacteroidales bacterium]